MVERERNGRERSIRKGRTQYKRRYKYEGYKRDKGRRSNINLKIMERDTR
jgi:hypothetical protein